MLVPHSKTLFHEGKAYGLADEGSCRICAAFNICMSGNSGFIDFRIGDPPVGCTCVTYAGWRLLTRSGAPVESRTTFGRPQA